uniref:pancreatic alpha-amylase n=1 Tax=Lonchura striata TaxID=40157 RepID=UPI000B4C83D3|nr:pancreatic alpha-amylase [Lonchura striata domestica]
MQVLLLLLAATGLCWGQYNPNTYPKRTSIVHLFEWRWQDIAQECERYLAPNGFGGVQVSPPNENIVITNPNRPWWERYQPISYKICTRSGNEQEFRDMVTRCNNVGVRIYVDAVVNHMCGAGGGSGTHSTCGSYFNAGKEDFPAVPYSGWDFNDGKCHTGSGEIENYGDMYQNDWYGPPSNSDGSTKAVTINPDTTCGNDWVCEHRWRQIRNMVIFRNVVDGEPFSNWWDNGSNQVAFGRGNKGFIIFNNDDWNMNVNVQTGLPSGTYCDVISGQKENNKCTGKQVFVSGDGKANFQINTNAEDPFIAIHVDAKL